MFGHSTIYINAKPNNYGMDFVTKNKRSTGGLNVTRPAIIDHVSTEILLIFSVFAVS